MPAVTTSSLTATGSVTLTKLATDNVAFCEVSGTYGTVTFVFEGSIDGANFFPIAATAMATGNLVTGTVSPADNGTLGYKMPADGLGQIRLRTTAVGSGTVAVTWRSDAMVGNWMPSTTNLGSMTFGATTFAGDLTLGSGGTLILDTPSTLAGTGTNQGTAAAIADQVTFVTAADGTVGVVLPSAAAGMVRMVYNTHATAGMKIYPASGDDINDGTSDAAVTIEGKTLAIFVALDSTTWASIYTVNT